MMDLEDRFEESMENESMTDLRDQWVKQMGIGSITAPRDKLEE